MPRMLRFIVPDDPLQNSCFHYTSINQFQTLKIIPFPDNPTKNNELKFSAGKLGTFLGVPLKKDQVEELRYELYFVPLGIWIQIDNN